MTNPINIGGVVIGDEAPCFIIAELSANHLQDFDIAIRLIDEAHKAGANAVKIQTYTPDTITIDVRNDDFKISQGTVWDGQYLYDLYKMAYTPWDWQPKLKSYTENQGLIFFSSPFDVTSVDFLEKLEVPAYKIASYEITDTNLIQYVAQTGKPVLISTGIAAVEDINLAIETCRNAGNEEIILLKCTSSYPANLNEVNLLTMADYPERFGVIPGISDHTLGSTVPLCAVALGAKVVEKHLILDRAMGGPDEKFSMTPREFKKMVSKIRDAETALGKVNYQLNDKMRAAREHSRSLYVVTDMIKGEPLTADKVRSIRPGYGLHPRHLNELIGRNVNRDIPRGTPMSLDMVD